MSDGPKKCAIIAVIGAPNAGKSSLVNRLVGAKVSIVTHKVQTTRARVRGVAIEGDAQLVFIDTPGIFAPRRRLDRAMVRAAWESLDGADAILMTIDAAEHAEPSLKSKSVADANAIIDVLKQRGVKTDLVVNKIDQLSKLKLLPLVQSLNETGVFSETWLVSAKDGDGVSALKAALAARAPEGPWMYPEDQLSDISDRLMAAEATREKIYLRLHEELPYQTAVETTKWGRTAKGELRIEQTIYVSRESHRPIVLGKGGQTLKALGSAARAELSALTGEPVHLFLEVKVKENWTDDPARYRDIGLDFVE
ncbi:MAG: GTPase Era [Parvularculaceae bacterium]